ncbi:MAG TPA: hypothetical protein VFM18_23755, partial [Methanosarcina sp.]|nr:hypothetical protein [Methanosarcina sp.]
DTTIGVDYFGQVFGKNRSLETIDALIQSQILAEQDVKKLSTYTSTLYGDRGLSITFEVQDATGQTTQPITVNVGV